ncbi:MAG TPA: hypothetical protein VM821_03725 [Abditibacteriaceae bacterium]|nr:hypothetical protein [Abditibacteriaceae bacterium]
MKLALLHRAYLTIIVFAGIVGRAATANPARLDVCDLAFSPQGTILAATRFEDDLSLWKVQKTCLARQRQIKVFSVSTNAPLAFSADGRTLAVGSNGSELWDVRNGKKRRLERERVGYSNNFAFSPDGRWLLGGQSGGEILLWDTRMGRLRAVFNGGAGRTYSTPLAVAFVGKGKEIVSAHGDGNVYIWDIRTAQITRRFRTGYQTAWFSLRSEQDILASRSHGAGNPVKIWSLRTGKLLKSLPQRGELGRGAVSPDGKRIVTWSYDGTATMYLWSVKTGKVLRRWSLRKEGWLNDIEYSPNGKIIATGHAGGSIKLWDAL